MERHIGRRETRRRAEAVGGFLTNDLTVDFYERVRAIVGHEPNVVDFGAGRGEWLEDSSPRRKALRDLRDIAGRIVGLDVDPAVKTNPTLDEPHVIDGLGPLPVEDGWADLVLAEWVLEHLDDPAWFAAECARITRPGGWVCGRTPNRSGYIAWAGRAVPNRLHVSALRRLQPDRKAEDVFPTRYRLNTIGALRRTFGDGWDDHSFAVWPNLAYGGHVAALERAERLWRTVAPDRLAPVLYVFLRRREEADGDQ